MWLNLTTNAGFRLTCRLPHCRFDDDICSTAQAPLAAEGWPSGKQRQANRSITLPLCPPRQIADSWILFNSGAMPLGDKAKAALPLWAATLKQQAMITRHSGKAASSKLVWNQHNIPIPDRLARFLFFRKRGNVTLSKVQQFRRVKKTLLTKHAKWLKTLAGHIEELQQDT